MADRASAVVVCLTISGRAASLGEMPTDSGFLGPSCSTSFAAIPCKMVGRGMTGRTIHRLRAVTLTRVMREGYHPDGGGLDLQATAAGSKSWIFRYSLVGKRREMGLG